MIKYFGFCNFHFCFAEIVKKTTSQKVQKKNASPPKSSNVNPKPSNEAPPTSAAHSVGPCIGLSKYILSVKHIQCVRWSKQVFHRLLQKSHWIYYINGPFILLYRLLLLNDCCYRCKANGTAHKRLQFRFSAAKCSTVGRHRAKYLNRRKICNIIGK